MKFTDRIMKYDVGSSIPPSKIKTSRECYVLANLKYFRLEEFSCLTKGESPDLQSTEGELGIEVVWGGLPFEEIINGENYKYMHAKTECDKQKCLRKIRKKGGEREEYCISFPVSTAQKEKENIETIFQKT